MTMIETVIAGALSVMGWGIVIPAMVIFGNVVLRMAWEVGWLDLSWIGRAVAGGAG